MKQLTGITFCLLTALFLLSCADHRENTSTRNSLVVTATAFNSVEKQTDSTPTIGAWGDRLKPGMKTIAVSRDLLDMGLTRGVAVHIEGLEGEYIVLDKMAKRWTRRIDIYMGNDVDAAKKWGKRQVRISW